MGVGYLCIIQFLPLWCDKVKDAIKGTREGHASDQQDDQHNVGKCGCEINHLSREQTRKGEMSYEIKRESGIKTDNLR